jgi:hypothetical protein
MTTGLLFEWAAARAPVVVRNTVEAQIAGVFSVEGRERACVLHLSNDRGFWSIDVRDRAGAQLQGFDGVSLARVLSDVREAGVSFEHELARKIGRALDARPSAVT